MEPDMGAQQSFQAIRDFGFLSYPGMIRIPGSPDRTGWTGGCRDGVMRSFLIFLLIFCGPVRADECDSLPPPSVTLRRIEAPVSVDTRYDYKSITVLSTDEHHPAGRVLGLTRGTARVGFEIRGKVILDASQRWECVSPQIVLSYGFSPLTVYVAREFPPGSCAYREIHLHELRHVETYREHAAAIEPDLLASLKRRFATGAPTRAPVGETRARLERELQERWLPYVQREMERVRASQALIDTPEEYLRVSGLCHGEIQRGIR
jgi:hypothetical protein